MNQTIKWTLAVSGLAALAALVAPWSVGDVAIRREIAQYVQQRTGLVGTLEGRMVLALAPQPTLKIEDVSFRDRSGAVVVEAAAFKGALRLLPLFGGRIELGALSLSDARIEIDAARLPDGAAPFGSATSEPRGSIALASAEIFVRHGERGLAHFSNVDAAYEWPLNAAAASISASGLWKGERIEAGLWVGQFDALRRNEMSPAIVKIETPRASGSFNGQIELGVRPVLEGKMSLSANSFSEVLTALGVENPLPTPLRGLTATGAVKASPQNIALTDARFSVDGTSYEGSIALSWREGRPLVSGTLAANQLQLAPFLARFPPLSDDNGWNNETIGRVGIANFDLDLRLSAARARFERFQMQDAGFAVKASDGQFDVSLIDARGYGGRLKGRFIAGVREAGISTKITASLAQIDSAALLNDLFRLNVLAGEATATLTLESAGDCIADLMQSLGGRVEATIQNGDLLGIDLDSALRRSEKRPLSVATEIRRGRTSFARAGMTARVVNGALELDDASANGFSLATQISGGVRLQDRALQLRIVSTHTLADGAPKSDSPRIALDVTGAWDDPQLDIDFESLLRKSEAAAPLFNSAAPRP